MCAQKLSFDYAHTLHTVRIVHNAHSVHRSRVQKGKSCDCINFVRATAPCMGSGHILVYAIQDSNGINRNQLQFFGWSMGDVERNKAVTQVEYLLDTFRDAKEFGSILNVDMLDWELLYRFAGTVDYSDQISMDELNLETTKDALWTLIEQGAVLAQKYDVVVTNPPYMAVSNVGAKVNDYVKKNFPDSKADMFAVFIECCGQMANKNGYMVMYIIHASGNSLRSGRTSSGRWASPAD